LSADTEEGRKNYLEVKQVRFYPETGLIENFVRGELHKHRLSSGTQQYLIFNWLMMNPEKPLYLSDMSKTLGIEKGGISDITFFNNTKNVLDVIKREAKITKDSSIKISGLNKEKPDAHFILTLKS
jgi:hypothetical protein